MSGIELLTRFRDTRSEDAFAGLVRSFSGLVFSAATRRVGRPDLAEDVAQGVFLRLAKSPPRLKSEPELVAWLHRTTLHVAIDTWRTESRRRNREQKAAIMQTATSEPLEIWEEIAPQLDTALDNLREADRQVLLLRFFQQKSMREVGELLGLSEDAAKMRVGRALEKLRSHLAVPSRCSAAVLASLLTERGLEAVPVQLGATLASTEFLALSGAGTGSTLLPTVLLMKMKIVLPVLLLVSVPILIYYNNSTDHSSRESQVPALPENGRVSARASIQTGRRALPGEFLSATGGAAEIEDAKRALYNLLQQPQYSGAYPPVKLTAVLSRFAGVYEQALPILLEAARREDHETRMWAVSGINYLLLQARQNSPETADQLLNQARPVLGSFLRSNNTPELLRSLALSAYLPPPFWINGIRQDTGILLPEAGDDLLAAMRQGARLGNFRFTVADHLSHYFEDTPQQMEPFAEEMRQLVKTGDPQDRFLGAFALAIWPGEKPAGIKAILVEELKERTPYSYRAAVALGRMGSEAADAVPALLEYAKATAEWSAGYQEHALTAACRIDPSLRTQHPRIDARLKEEEEMRSRILQPAPPEPLTPAKLAAQLADPDSGAATLEGILTAAHSAPGEHSQEMLELLRAASAQATEAEAPAVNAAIKAFEERAAQVPATPEPPSVPVAAVLLDARILLVNHPNENERKIETALEQFQEISNEQIMPNTFAQISAALKEIDPAFQKRWHEQVLKTYPWLDRALPKVESVK